MKTSNTATENRQGPGSVRFRLLALRCWTSAIERVVTFDMARKEEISDFLLPVLYAYVLAELSHLDESLGVDDADKIEKIVLLFDISEREARTHFEDAAAQATRHAEDVRSAAIRRLDERRTATLGHRKLVDGKTLSAALNLTKERKLSIFAGSRTIVDGKVVVGKRFNSRLPTFVEHVSAERGPEGKRRPPWSLSLADRRRLRDRLGYELTTISRKQRNLTEEEFLAWTVKRESLTWPAEKLAGLKQPGESDYAATQRIKATMPKTRQRKPGVTAARRAYAVAQNCGMTKAKAVTKGMSAEAILAMAKVGNVTHATRYGCYVRPVMSAEKALFPVNSSALTGGDGSLGKEDATDVEIELRDNDRIALNGWYLAAKGKVLTQECVRQWRKRGMVERMLYTACQHVEQDSEMYPPAVVLNALVRLREANRRKDERKKRDRLSKIKLSSNIFRLYG